MASLIGQFVRKLTFMAGIVLAAACASAPGFAAPYAAIVMDARTGETLYAKNADTRLHPASLTKMMTLYITFGAIEHGEISLDTMVTVSQHAASQPPSRLGLRAGQRIALRYLIRAAAVKSANDAAAAIAEAISGSTEKFSTRMNRTAKALGMRNSTFRNANGLTAAGHMSTARDMTLLGRRLFYDFPQYYGIFSRRSTDAGVAQVANTNRRFLDSYQGADGIKTGYTAPAGFNLTASAERGNKRIIATIFGGTSTAQRNAKMTELLDLGFGAASGSNRAPAPSAPAYEADQTVVADAGTAETAGAAVAAGKTIRLVTTPNRSPRPKGRPVQVAAAAEVAVAMMQGSIADALAEAAGVAPEPQAPAEISQPDLQDTAAASAAEPALPELTVAETAGSDATNIMPLSSANAATPQPEQTPTKPVARVIHTATPQFKVAEAEAVPTDPEVVTRISTSGGRHWGVNIGRFGSHGAAERALMQTGLAENTTLKEGLRKIVQRSGGYDANFMGLTQDQADLACRRLQARGTQCFAIGP